MAFSDMNDVEQELGEEKPPEKNGNRTFLIIAGTLGGIMVLALLCIAGLALYRYLPGHQAAQQVNATVAVQQANATIAVQETSTVQSAIKTASVPTATATKQPTFTPTNTRVPTNTPVIVLAPTKSPTFNVAIATNNALLTQTAQHLLITVTSNVSSTATPPKATATALPKTGIADELGTPGLIAAAFILLVIIFIVRRLRSAF